MILGTAGHIDHGKTALVRALTGVDTDRLPEERRRGITIELGFAPLQLEGVGTVSVVDVPGHEAFVRTMLAGAAGIDLALFVVAADEGVMPQTREHLAILGALGIRGGVVALTKCDLVDESLLALAMDDVSTLLRSSALDGAPIIPVSVRSGVGLDALRQALTRAAAAVPARTADDLFRLPIDRVFTVKGTGTVITGTVWSGRVRRDDVVCAFPGGIEYRVRGVESHGQSTDEGAAGQRVAVALAGADREQLARGGVLVAPSRAWTARDRMRADVALFDDADIILTARTRVRLHLGTTEVGARVVARGGGVTAGKTVPVRLVLDAPIVARGGDRFVLRAASPVTTIGGGVITDAAPPFRRVLPFASAGAPLGQRLRWMVEEEGSHGLDIQRLSLRLGVRPSEHEALIAQLAPDVLMVGDVLAPRSRMDAARRVLLQMVDDGHRARPLDRGVPLQPVRAALGVGDALAAYVVREAVEQGVVRLDDGMVARAEWTPKLTPADQAAIASIQELLGRLGREAPTAAEITAVAGSRTPALLRLLEREGEVVPIGDSRYIAKPAWRDALVALRSATGESRLYTASELREIFGVSRKFSIPLLEGCDRVGVCNRQGDGRRFHWDKLPLDVLHLLDSSSKSP